MDVKFTGLWESIQRLLTLKLSASRLLAPVAALQATVAAAVGFLSAVAMVGGSQLIFVYPAQADSSDAEFYHQLLKIPAVTGYQPTRNFTIVIDTEHGNQLIADDDATLRFNQLWLQQFQPGNQDRRGGAAFGEMFRSFFKQVYKNYRSSHAQDMAGYPDENGSIKRSSYSTSMDYNIKLTDDEVRFKIQYSF